MINVLIVCNNFVIVKKIVNEILHKIENLKIIGIIDNLDLKTETLEKETNLIITNNTDLVSQVINNQLLSSIKIVSISFNNFKCFDNKNVLEINYFSPNNIISDTVKYFISTTFNDPSKDKIITILKNIGFDFNLIGTIYLIDSIVYIHFFKEFSFDTLQKDIYPYVANLNNTTISRVKWAIERCIKYLYRSNSNTAFSEIYHYFGIRYPNKITPKTLINLISNSL